VTQEKGCRVWEDSSIPLISWVKYYGFIKSGDQSLPN